MPNLVTKSLQYIYYLIRFPILYFLWYISSLIPKNKNIWIFGAREGNSFSGNSKYLFIYLKNYPDIKVIWISKNKRVVKNLEKIGLKGYYIYSFRGIFFCLRAFVCFTTHGIYDINPYLTKGCIHVELWHVTFPLKKMEYDTKNHIPKSFIKKALLILRTPFIFQKADYAISSSEWTKQIIRSALLIKEEKILVTGCIRSDRMIEPENEADRLTIENILPTNNFAHLIYFFPTWRNNYEFDLFSFSFDETELVAFLEKTDSILLIGVHPFDLSITEKHNYEFHDRICIINTQDVDTVPILKKSSDFITDYSSTFAGYLLFDRPMIFANFDHNSYIAERELYWDYDEITPGDKAESWSLILLHLEKILLGKKDLYKMKRQVLRDKIYQFKDGKSCSRVVSEVQQILLKED